MNNDIMVFIVLGIIALLLMAIPIYWLVRKMKTETKKSFFQKAVDAVLLPVNFGALFLEKRRIDQLPFYYRWFLRFTKFTSRISYFHFLPKAVIALISEMLIMFFTGEDTLTAIVFSWSVLFLLLITLVEGKSGEMEEDTIVFANKLFLYTVSMLTLFILIIYFFFWDFMGEFFNTPFLVFMGEFAHAFNEWLIQGALFFWELPLPWKLVIIGILIFYIIVSVWVSKKLKK